MVAIVVIVVAVVVMPVLVVASMPATAKAFEQVLEKTHDSLREGKCKPSCAPKIDAQLRGLS
jgi:hypothetical protein